jgi:hypothetical protein
LHSIFGGVSWGAQNPAKPMMIYANPEMGQNGAVLCMIILEIPVNWMIK